jgi:hypothetical protein
MPSIKLLFSFYLTKVYVELFFVVKQSLLCLCLLLQKKGPLLISLANEFVRALYMALLALSPLIPVLDYVNPQYGKNMSKNEIIDG